MMSVVAMESYCMKTVMIHLAISYYLITKHVAYDYLCSSSGRACKV